MQRGSLCMTIYAKGTVRMTIHTKGSPLYCDRKNPLNRYHMVGEWQQSRNTLMAFVLVHNLI